jgi:hypothetical protein
VPAEFAAMAGRRLEQTLPAALAAAMNGGPAFASDPPFEVPLVVHRSPGTA